MREKKDSETTSNNDNGASELLDKGKKTVTDGLEGAEQIYGEAIKEATKLIKKHPLEAVAITFGIGCLLGIVISRR